MSDSSISLVAEIVIIILGLLVCSASITIIYMRCRPHTAHLQRQLLYKISKQDSDVMHPNSRSEVVGLRPTELHANEKGKPILRYSATSSVARDGHRVRLLADMSSPRVCTSMYVRVYIILTIV